MKSRAGPRRALHWEGVPSPNGALTLLARHSPALDACSQLRTLNRGSSAAGKMGFFFFVKPQVILMLGAAAFALLQPGPL